MNKNADVSSPARVDPAGRWGAISLTMSKLHLIFFLLLPACAGTAAAQTGAEALYDLDVRGLPLQEALGELQAQTRLPLLYSPELLKGKHSQCVIEDASSEALLTCVLRGTGLAARRLSSGTYVLEQTGEDVTLSGFIENAATGTPLPGATVYAPRTALGTTSNRYGFYSLTLPAGAQPLVFSYTGYRTQRDTLDLSTDMSRRVELRPRILLLDSLRIEGDRTPAQATQRPGVMRLTPRAIRQMPALLGATDALKTAQMLPGVTFGVEGTNSLYVRGGSADQNKILLDGIPLHHSSHLLGILSSFNPDVLERMTVFKGAFPAKYGGRLSSVIDVDLREGNRYEYESEGAIGLLSSRLMVEGPIREGKSAFLLAGRRSYADLVMQPFLTVDGEEAFGIYFYDVNGVVNHTFSPSDRLNVNLYSSRDRFYLKGAEQVVSTQLTWANLAGSLRWNHLFNDRLFNNTTLTFSRYGFYGDLFVIDDPRGTFNYKYLKGITGAGLRSDFEYFPVPNHTLSFGAVGKFRRYQPGRATFPVAQDGGGRRSTSLPAEPVKIDTWRGAVYAEDEWDATKRLRFILGLRGEAYFESGESHLSIQPRLSSRYSLNENVALRAAYASTRQYQHRLIATSSLVLPTDVWSPATSIIPPSRARQVSLSASYAPQGDPLFAEVGIYYKKMSRLSAYDDLVRFTNIGRDFEQHVTQGQGRSYGFEFLLRRTHGRTTGWLAYTLSWTNRQFDELNNGRPFPFRFDRRHALNLALTHRLSGSFLLSTTWTYATGQAISVPSGHYYGPDGVLEYLPSINNFRLPAYHRLDVGAIWDIGRNHTLAFGVYNAYNEVNPVFIERHRQVKTEDRQVFEEGPLVQEEGPLIHQGTGILPILPYVQYRFTLF